jgi:hypothetical protein
MSTAQIRGSILGNWPFQGVQTARNRAHCQNGRIQLVVRSIRSTIGIAGLHAKSVLVQREVDSDMKCCRYDRFDMGAISLQKGQSSSDHDRHRLSVTLISLSPSFVRHASTAAMLRRFSAHARFHATALSPPSPLFRASTCNDPRHSYVASFSCGRRLSVAPLDLHVEIILMCIGPLCATSHAPPL